MLNKAVLYLIVGFIMVLLVLQLARADMAAEAAIFRGCADQALADGDAKTAAVFLAAIPKGEDQALRPRHKPSRSLCLTMRSAAEMYGPMLKQKGQVQ